MPAGGSYSNMRVGDGVATTLKRRPASQVSYNNTKLRPRTEGGNGKFGGIGLPMAPSGGSMNTGGKKRPGSRTVR